ncbi:MAG: biopolymer transporter ExbD [Planctomycetaceae bacterium]|jgi:biopolymer transport protein ExbD|nr:biopolymer transporter ExbD [Planctomycetaceae bacterium]
MKRRKIFLEKPRLNMTPMIDVVFLLLTFFVMTFKIITPEGDFNVNMTAQGQAAQHAEVPKDPVRIVLTANQDGTLAGIRLNDGNVADMNELRNRIKALVQVKADLEVELVPDETLHYAHVIEAVSAVNGEVVNGQVKKICDKIKFVKVVKP